MKILSIILFLISFNLFATTITVHDLNALIKENNPNTVILDVRTPGEFAQGHISNALNLNAYDKELHQKLNTLNKDLDYFVICRSGNRSSKVYRKMIDLNFPSVFNILGGMIAWERANYLYK